MIIRPHVRSDADRIAEILADGWRDTYAEFVPPDYIAYQSDRVRRRTEVAEWLDGEFDPTIEAIFVAEDDGKIVGFIHVEHGDKGELGATGIVNLLYIDRSAHGRGIGRVLMAAGVQWLAETKPGPVVLSAFELNPNRGFYERLGGVERQRVVHDIKGTEVWSVLYLWADPAVLLAR
ncbi:MAG: GNAT family N-acetyltransferase [Devosia sp.]